MRTWRYFEQDAPPWFQGEWTKFESIHGHSVLNQISLVRHGKGIIKKKKIRMIRKRKNRSRALAFGTVTLITTPRSLTSLSTTVCIPSQWALSEAAQNSSSTTMTEKFDPNNAQNLIEVCSKDDSIINQLLTWPVDREAVSVLLAAFMCGW